MSLTPYGSMGNNPISFVDPEGDLPFIAVVGIGAATGIFGNGLSNISQGNNFFDGAGKAAFWGGIGAAASLGVGTVFGATGTFAKELGRAGAHAITQGGMSAAQGGNFWQGALSGGISSGIGSGIDALGGKAGHQILGGGLGGGIGSSIGGGNFFDGFSQGVAVGAFNHTLHSGFSTDPPWLKKLKEAYNNFWKSLGFGDDIPTYNEVQSVLIDTEQKVQDVVELQITAATFFIPIGRLGMLGRYFGSLELLAGAGNVIAKGRKIDDLPRLIATYGGNADDWTKVVSRTTYTGRDGFKFSIHWYEKSGTRFEIKTVIGR